MKRKFHNVAGESVVITDIKNNVLPLKKDFYRAKKIVYNTSKKSKLPVNNTIIQDKPSEMTQIPLAKERRSVEFDIEYMTPSVKQLLKVDSSPGTLLHNHDGATSVLRQSYSNLSMM